MSLDVLVAGSMLCSGFVHSGHGEEAPAGGDPEPDTVSRTVYDLGDHTVEFRQVTETTLPTLPPKAEPVAPSEPSPETLAQRNAWRMARARAGFLSLGGTVHRYANQPPWTEIRCFAGSGGEPVVIHSSIDWNLLRSGHFTLPDGSSLSLMLVLDTTDEDRMTAAFAARGKIYMPPTRPAFPPGKASWTVVSGLPTPELATKFDALHLIHDQTYEQLVAALRAAEQASAERQREEAARASQPPSNVVIRYRALTTEELNNR